jgi:hypothetical protein
LSLKPEGMSEAAESHLGRSRTRAPIHGREAMSFLSEGAEGEESSPSRRQFTLELSWDWWFCSGMDDVKGSSWLSQGNTT